MIRYTILFVFRKLIVQQPVSRLRRSILNLIHHYHPELPLSDGICIRPTEIVRLCGTPYKSTAEDIKNFLSGLEIVEGGINFLYATDKRTFGDVFVELNSPKEVKSAIEERDGLTIGNRTITLKKTSMCDLDHLLFAGPMDLKAQGYLLSPELLRYIENACIRPKRGQFLRGFEILITLLKRVPWSKSSLAFINDLCRITITAARALRERVISGYVDSELFKVFVDVSLNAQGFLNSQIVRLYFILFDEMVRPSENVGNASRDKLQIICILFI
jgi:hypothetical protein